MISTVILALLLVAALTGTWLLRNRAYRRFFRYEVRRDQAYSFAPEDVTSFPIALEADCFLWPEKTGEADTALLELSLDASLAGHWTEPWIEARTRHFYLRQYFERGASGQRYLNLSALVAESPKPGQRCWLHGSGMTWKPSARLLLFRNPWPARPRSVIIAPHPDDAEIAAFGLYVSSDSTVVTLTSGDLGSFDPGATFADPEQRCAEVARVRTLDSITAPVFGGVPPERAINLGYFDSTLAAAFAQPAASVAPPGVRRTVAEMRALNRSLLLVETDVPPTWDALVRDLVRLFDTTNPELIATPHPLLDDHPDHAFATVAVCEALAQLGPRDGHLLLYTNHTPWSNLHPVGANDGAVSLPPHFGTPLTFRSLKSLPLSPESQRRKLLALEAHHDLRALPSLTRPTLPMLLRSFAAGWRDQVTGFDRHATSYFRRAVRPNELFFVVPFAEASALRDEFLAAWRAGRVEWHRSK